MRIAIISDIHGNLTALDAVLADLRAAESRTWIFARRRYGVTAGANPAEVIDCIVQEGLHRRSWVEHLTSG